jgi:3-carboxy-cis,cis-muconate cycloisomerase
LLSPATVGHDAVVSDQAVVDALVTAEVGLVRAMAAVGAVDAAVSREVGDLFGWVGAHSGCRDHGVDAVELATRASGGNPVIPLVEHLRGRTSERAREWVHRGATSQDILDTAIAIVARNAVATIVGDLERTTNALAALAGEHRETTAAARTLTQHAVPTTVGARAAAWARGVERARSRIGRCGDELPVQLGGAAGTLAAFVTDVGRDAAAALPTAFAAELGLTASAPWHTERWPITELGDALVQVIDALGKIAADVATLSRTEIGEIGGAVGGSSAMPQKANPIRSILIRSAAVRAPQLGATLHLAAALAVDERPDGAWHAEWPTVRELLRLALGAAAHAAALSSELRVDRGAVRRNLSLTGGLIVSERLAQVLEPIVGRDRFRALIAEAGDGDLGARIRALPEATGLDVDELLDPSSYTGLAAELAEGARLREVEE